MGSAFPTWLERWIQSVRSWRPSEKNRGGHSDPSPGEVRGSRAALAARDYEFGPTGPLVTRSRIVNRALLEFRGYPGRFTTPSRGPEPVRRGLWSPRQLTRHQSARRTKNHHAGPRTAASSLNHEGLPRFLSTFQLALVGNCFGSVEAVATVKVPFQALRVAPSGRIDVYRALPGRLWARRSTRQLSRRP